MTTDLTQTVAVLKREYRVDDIRVSVHPYSDTKVTVQVVVEFPDLGRTYQAHVRVLRYRYNNSTDFTSQRTLNGLLTRIRNDMNSAYKVGAPKPRATQIDMMSAILELNKHQDGSFSFKEGPEGQFTLRYTLPAGAPQGYLDWVVDPIREAFSNVSTMQYPERA